ncbi:MAG: CARDB domain-containing protein [Thermoanaerobaculia bacterium]
MGRLLAVILAVPALGLAGASQGQPLPNLTPFQPTGWSDKIVVSKTAGTNSDSSPLVATDTLYVDWALINNGSAATGARFYAELYVDGALRASWFTDPPLNPNFYAYVEDYSIGPLSVGTHTLRIKADSTGVIAESNETDNEFTRTITVAAGGGLSCVAGPTTLCLNNGRFKVQVSWRVPAQGTSGAGNAVSLTGDTGYFWFFSSNNIELVIKVLDGRALNNAYWVFYGALSNVEYTITVTDTQTGSVKTYFNPAGQLGSVADTSAFSPDSPYSVLVENLKQVTTQARMNKENFPAMIRPGAETYNPEIVQLIAAGSSAVGRILDEFRRPTTILDETPLSLLAYALEKINDPSAIPVLTDWLEQNLFAELNWATDFVTHTIKVLGRQSGVNTTTYIYGIDEKLDTIAQARVGHSAAEAPLSVSTCSEAAADNTSVCPQKIIVTGINSAGQQESVTLNYKVAKRDIQDIINAATGPEKSRLEAHRDGWQSTDQTNYGGTDYVPLSGAQISLKSNCAGTVTEHVLNTLSAQKGFSVTLPQGAGSADEIRALARKFGGEVPLSGIDTLTVISHDSDDGASKHVEVPAQADANSALVYSKDNYGLLRQHTVSKSSIFNSFLPAQRAYGNRPWYLGGATPITTRFYRVDPNRIVSIVVDSSACPCNPTASDAIAVAITQPTAATTDQRVITVAGTVGNPAVTSATLKVNGFPQTITVTGGAFSSQVVLRSGDNTLTVDVTAPDGRRGCAQTTIRSTTPRTTISVTLTWNLASSDVDLYVTQPDGETSWYQNKTTSIGGRLDVDNTSGFGPENYFLSSEKGDRVLAGVYTIRVHYYRDHLKTDQTPTRVVSWRVVLLLNEGTASEKREIYSGSLSAANSGNASPGSSGSDWATAKQLTFTP